MRRILCVPCGHDYQLHPLDVGFNLRKVTGLAHKPAVHERSTTEFKGGMQTLKITEDLPSLLCDQCGKPIADGTRAVAVTMWRGSDEPVEWESEYLAPLPVDPVLQPLVDAANEIALGLKPLP